MLWSLDTYYYYAFAIFVITTVSITAEIRETRRNLLNTRQMALYNCQVSALRFSLTGNGLVSVPSSSLVPGDVIEIASDSKAPCDCVLLSGSCIVNEAMLTGESIPVMKLALPYTHDVYNPDEDRRYTVYSGTEVIQARCAVNSKVCALVVRTGFASVKGSLVRYILCPKQSKFKFYSDSYKYIAVMFCMSFIGMWVQLANSQDVPTVALVKKCLDLVTITVPPALPACLSIGSSFALSRLRNKDIFCISPQKVNVAGRVNVVCFDKTGTLTDEGLSVHGFRVVAVKAEKLVRFKKLRMSVNELGVKGMYSAVEEYEEKKGSASALFVEALASCHSLTKVNGKLIGDPLDLEMFRASEWMLDESETGEGDPGDAVCSYVVPNAQHKAFDWTALRAHNSPYQLGIVRRFEFASKLQRMSVLVQNLREMKYRVYTKGAPEKMKELCRSSSLPKNYGEVLARYTKKGFRVLALGTRELNLNYIQAQKVTREAVENKLVFIGFLILKNRLKPTTTEVITELHSAGIKTIMLTGDNPYTAISVGKECGLIPGGDGVVLGECADDLCGDRVTWSEVSAAKKPRKAKHRPRAKNYSLRLSSWRSSSSESAVDEYMPRQMTDSLELETERVVRAFPFVTSRQAKDSDDVEDLIMPGSEKNLSYAITGKAIDQLLRKDPLCTRSRTKRLLSSISVYARMSPESKARLVEALEKLGNVVGMCGDGANDCAALKAADVGVSLSEAEASIAAPFTSKTPDIKCIIKLLREGRAALATSFQCFKYMALYSLIQFVSVSILYSLKLNLTDMQFLVIDLFTLLPIAVTMSWTKAARSLSKQMPMSDLLSLPVLASIIGQSIIQCTFQVLIFNL